MHPDGFSFSSTPTPDPDTDLAYRLQHAAPGDPNLLDDLIQRYGAEIYRLANAQAVFKSAWALNLTRDVFLDAARSLDSFFGRESVRTWLVELTLQRFPGKRALKKIRQSLTSPAENPRANLYASADPHPTTGDFLDAPTRHLIIVLRYLLDLSPAQISTLLACEPRQLHTALTAARRTLLPAYGFQLSQTCAGWTDDNTPPTDRLQQKLDGLLDDDPYAAAALRTHLSECPACRQESETWLAFERRLSEDLRARFPGLSAPALVNLRQETRAALAAPPKRLNPAFWRIASAAGLLAAALFAVFWVFNRTTPPPPEPGQVTRRLVQVTATPLPRPPPVTPARTLPEPIPLPAQVAAYRANRGSASPGANVSADTPLLAGDGSSLVFTSSSAYWVPGDDRGEQQVYAYDLQTRQVQRLSQNARGAPGAGASYEPLISGDGQMVAFLTNAPNLLPGGSSAQTCYSYATGDLVVGCADLLLLDRQSGTLTQVSASADGQALQALVSSPALAADGRTLVFLSSAQNLAGLDPASPPSLCPAPAEQARSFQLCLDLFFYDIPTGRITRVPLGRGSDRQSYQTELSLAPSLSADGRYAALALSRYDLVAETLGVNTTSAAYVYDRQADRWLNLAETPGGPLPDGRSFAPALSADGTTAAFVASASNLVPDDTNRTEDVFVRSLAGGPIERVSLAADGSQGYSPSGMSLVYSSRSPSRLALSADGSRVVFISAAPNLDSSLPDANACWFLGDGEMCSNVYLHDRPSQQTRLVSFVNSPQFYAFPSISADGSLVSFYTHSLGCTGSALFMVCGDTWIYDQVTGQAQSLLQAVSGKRKAASPLDESLQQTLDGLSRAVHPPADLPNLSTDERLILDAHTGWMNALDVSPDGQLLATGGDDRRVILWDTATLEQIDLLTGYTAAVTAVRFTPDGAWLATGDRAGQLFIWRVDDLAQSTPRRAVSVLRHAATGPIHGIAVSADNTWYAVASATGLWLWERQNLEYNLRQPLSLPDVDVHGVAFHPTQNLLAAGLRDGTTLLIELPSGRIAARLGGHDTSVHSLSFSPTGDRLATGSADGWVNLWSLSGLQVRPSAEFLNGFSHAQAVNGLVFAPGGTTLVTASMDETIRFSDAATGIQLDIFYRPSYYDYQALALSPDGNRLFAALGSGELLVVVAAQAAAPQFFSVADRDVLAEPPRDPPFDFDPDLDLSPLLGDLVFTPLPLDKLPVQFGENLLAAGSLPQGFNFLGYYQFTSASPVLAYSHVVDGEHAGFLALFQEPHDPSAYTMPISPAAFVRRVSFTPSPDLFAGGVDVGGAPVAAELVAGNWDTIRSSGTPTYTWNPGLPRLRLRWMWGNTVYRLDYLPVNPADVPGLDAAALLQIAADLRPVSDLLAAERLDLFYTVAAGESCTRLSSALGIEPMTLVRLNRLYGQDLLAHGCEIFPDAQEIVIPIYPAMYYQGDLGGGPEEERLALAPDPRGGLLGITLQTRDPTGVYRDYSLVQIEDNRQQRMRPPLVLDQNGQKLVVLHIDIDGSFNPRLLVMSWDGEHFATKLDGRGELEIFVDRDGRMIPRVRQVEKLAVGDCRLIYSSVNHADDPAPQVLGMLPACPAPFDISAAPPAEPASFYAGDLDCQPGWETLAVQPLPAAAPDRLAGFTLDWTPPFPDEPLQVDSGPLLAGVDAALPPRLLPLTWEGNGVPTCGRLIALPLSASQSAPGSTLIYRWAAPDLQLAAELPGTLAAYTFPDFDGPLHLLMIQNRLVADACLPALVAYAYTGETFTLLETLYAPNPLCTP